MMSWYFPCGRRIWFAVVGFACFAIAWWQFLVAFESLLFGGVVVVFMLLGAIAMAALYARGAGDVDIGYTKEIFKGAGVLVGWLSVALVLLAFAFTVWATLQFHGQWNSALRGFAAVCVGGGLIFLVSTKAFSDRMAMRVDSQRAVSINPQDKKFVDEYIVEKLGGFHEVDRNIKEALVSSLNTHEDAVSPV